MKGRVLVTGGTGMLGNNVIRTLLDDGWQVNALVRDGYDARCFQGLDVTNFVGDVGDAASLETSISSCQAIVHCAGVVQIGWSQSAGHQQVNVDGTRHIVDLATSNDLQLIHVSSVNALAFGCEPSESNEQTPMTDMEVLCNYVLSKRASDEIVLERISRAGLTATIVYPGFMLGPWDWKPSSGKMLQELAAGRALLAPRGGCSVCDVRDVARGIVSCLSANPISDRYILAGHNVTYLELWQVMSAVIGVRKPIGTFGPIISGVAGCAGDLWASLAGREPVVNSAAVRMSNHFHYYSSDLAKRELSYTTRPWEESVRDAWKWIQEHHSV